MANVVTERGKSTSANTVPTHGKPPASALPMKESARETIDSIVVAFILAFVFRAFVIEAFIIPTGSMAATLYGKHGVQVCQDCEWEFAYGLSDNPNVEQNVKSSSIAVCPNCGHANKNLALTDDKRNAKSGDRILVQKWPLDVGLSALGPRRWDVTVFKNPTNGIDNYIKRLVGLPQEVLEIIDGDIFTVPVDRLSPDARELLAKRVRAAYLNRPAFTWREPADMKKIHVLETERNRVNEGQPELAALNKEIRERTPGLLAELDQKYHVERKSDDAQESLWSVVYNHDYPPHNLDANQPRWQPAHPDVGAWDVSGRKLHFVNKGPAPESIQLAGKKSLDEYGYNVAIGRSDRHLVGDLRLSFVWVPVGQASRIELQLAKRNDIFTAALSADGAVELFHRKASDSNVPPKSLGMTKVDPFSPGVPVAVTFTNVDYRVALQIREEEVLATRDEQYPIDMKAIRLPSDRWIPPTLTASGDEQEFWHVVVERDVYYTPASLPGGEWNNQAGWGTTGNPLWLREGEYFMLGDNSPASQDSRYWSQIGNHLLDRSESYQVGTVPEDQLIGRAFFVYWPSGLSIPWVPGMDRLRIIPNVGHMRWIK